MKLFFYKLEKTRFSRMSAHEIAAAILLSQNNQTVAMFVSQTSPMGVKL